ncbi:MAG: IclR family transcriptional regulator [Chloroflexota bacterium]|nr:IclR family transcriptional regulator [Chloroflexota bacterium]
MTNTAAQEASPSERSSTRLKGDANAVYALRRGLSILDTFSAHHGDLGVNEIARIVGMHKSTVSRLCATLENAGYLERDPTTNRFRLGARIYQLAGSASPTTDVRAVARPVMQQLVETSRETATLGVREGSDIVTIDVVDGLNHMRMATRVGMRTQVHASAVAKAILAWMPEADVDVMLKDWPMTPLTPNTITDAADLKSRLHEVRERGYASDMEELEIGLRCVAAPIRDLHGRVVAGVSISGPRHQMTEEAMRRFGKLVKEAGETISARLGMPPAAQGRGADGNA